MSNFDLSNYRTVPERIEEARLAYPEGRFQTEILTLPPAFADKFIALKAKFFRTPDDPTPAEGVAWEPVPGKTPYTKDSELQNCETSAWGRALIAAFAADASKGIASREDVQSRQTPKRSKEPKSDTVKAEDALKSYIRTSVDIFSQWTEEQRSEAFKRLSGEILGGRAKDQAEVQVVVKAMADAYYSEHPTEAPF